VHPGEASEVRRGVGRQQGGGVGRKVGGDTGASDAAVAAAAAAAVAEQGALPGKKKGGCCRPKWWMVLAALGVLLVITGVVVGVVAPRFVKQQPGKVMVGGTPSVWYVGSVDVAAPPGASKWACEDIFGTSEVRLGTGVEMIVLDLMEFFGVQKLVVIAASAHYKKCKKQHLHCTTYKC
jgi:hypothetical protein